MKEWHGKKWKFWPLLEKQTNRQELEEVDKHPNSMMSYEDIYYGKKNPLNIKKKPQVGQPYPADVSTMWMEPMCTLLPHWPIHIEKWLYSCSGSQELLHIYKNNFV